MFEFHGWVNIRADDSDDADMSILLARQDRLVDELAEKVKEIEWPNGIFQLFLGVNGQHHLVMTGFANHRQPEVIDFFRWIADRQPHSYGLLHVWDDEDEETGHANVFRVFGLARGEVTESTEPLLSPCIPKIERPCQEPT